MTLPAVLAPVFVQVALIFFVLFRMGFARWTAVRDGQVEVRGESPRNYGWPRKAQAAADNFQNQFELPTLFFALVPLAILTHKADLLFVLLAWVFVVLRWLHALEHMRPNRLKLLFPIYAAGALVLLVMWAVFAARILLTL